MFGIQQSYLQSTLFPYFQNVYTMIGQIAFNNLQLRQSIEFYIYCLIRDDINASIFPLWGSDIDLNIFGFPVIKRNTRHLIESYFDLFNLIHTDDYSYVLRYCASDWKGKKMLKTEMPDRLNKYLENGHNQFNIYQKCQMALDYITENKPNNSNALNRFENYRKEAQKYNSFVHPNISIPPKQTRQENIKELGDLLLLNAEILFYAAKEILNVYDANGRDLKRWRFAENSRMNLENSYRTWKSAIERDFINFINIYSATLFYGNY